MPSLSKSLLAAVHVAAFSALLIAPLAPVSALASPVPMPFPLMTASYYSVNRSTAYRRPAILNKTSMRKSTRVKHGAASANHNDTGASLARRAGPVTISKTTSKIPSNGRRADANNADGSDYYAKLNGYYNAASTHAKNIQSLAAQSSSVQDDDSGDFHQQAASELTSFHTSMLAFEAVLRQLGADKGLANYDRTDSIETLLKNTINVNKNLLSGVTTITYNLPIVGRTLGPIVYEIKCILDLTLDACENLTDAVLNALAPLLKPLIGKFTTTACNNGVDLPTCLLG